MQVYLKENFSGAIFTAEFAEFSQSMIKGKPYVIFEKNLLGVYLNARPAEAIRTGKGGRIWFKTKIFFKTIFAKLCELCGVLCALCV